MRLLKTMGVVLVTAALSFVLVPKVGASDRDQKTIITFDQAVEVPVAVLPPGTYVFKVVDVLETRNVIRVLDRDEDHVYSTFIAIPKYTDRPFEKTSIRFAERPVGSPAAIEAWFYPGRTDGHEFIYPMERTSLVSSAASVHHNGY
jgi:hypothetical protein